MKTSELIKLRYDTVALLYSNGNHTDIKIMIEKARTIINFVSTGNVLKKPEPTDK
jgi:hypothetical protein